MTANLPDKFFVTGTDTGIGKTFVSALLCLGLGSAYWKPVQSGLDEGTDSEWIQSVTGISRNNIFPETYKLNKPLSPHLSAAIDGVSIEMESFRLPDCKRLIVEGAGGIMVPLNKEALVIDLIKHLSLPALVVARSGLGTINHTVLTVKMLRQREIDVLGVIMNGEPNAPNKEAIEYYAQTKVLAQIPVINSVNPTSLTGLFNAAFSSWKKHEQTV